MSNEYKWFPSIVYWPADKARLPSISPAACLSFPTVACQSGSCERSTIFLVNTVVIWGLCPARCRVLQALSGLRHPVVVRAGCLHIAWAAWQLTVLLDVSTPSDTAAPSRRPEKCYNTNSQLWNQLSYLKSLSTSYYTCSSFIPLW